jgi:hypothetical protein
MFVNTSQNARVQISEPQKCARDAGPLRNSGDCAVSRYEKREPDGVAIVTPIHAVATSGFASDKSIRTSLCRN